MTNEVAQVTQRREMGQLEGEVLAALWAAPDAMTPAEVAAALDTDLAYTTVMTVLTRLWKKGLTAREARGRAYAYRPAISEADLAAQRMKATLQRVSDRDAALSRFVGSLPRRDERRLRQILEEMDTNR